VRLEKAPRLGGWDVPHAAYFADVIAVVNSSFILD
jgi:hypothetical protein